MNTDGMSKKRKYVTRVRSRILQLALAKGEISNRQAAKAARLPQAWFHLNALKRAGLLKHADYNTWKPTTKAEQAATPLT